MKIFSAFSFLPSSINIYIRGSIKKIRRLLPNFFSKRLIKSEIGKHNQTTTDLNYNEKKNQIFYDA